MVDHTACVLQDVADADEGHLRKVFNSLDLNGDGEITIDELQQVLLFYIALLYECLYFEVFCLNKRFCDDYARVAW